MLPHGNAGSTVKVKLRKMAGSFAHITPKFCGPEGTVTPPLTCKVPVSAPVVQMTPGPPMFLTPSATLMLSPGSGTPLAPAEFRYDPPELRIFVGTVEILKLPTRTCQPEALVVGTHSLTCQKVRSSTGSMESEV